MQTFRPVPFYYISTTDPAALSAEAAAIAMRRVREAGYGGIMFFNKPPTGFDADGYLGEPWFEAVGNFLQAAMAEELEFWVNDAFDYPPGDAAGRILKVAPHLVQWRLSRQADGEVVPVEVPWGFPAFEEPESSRLFIEFTYEEYWRRFREYFGHGLTGFFSDTDNRRFNHHVRARLGGEQYYPWSTHFAEVFQQRHGYDIRPRLNDLLEGKDAKLNLDYWTLAGELYQQWFRNNYEWCHAHGVKYSFHTSDTGPFARHECDRSSLYTEGLPLELFKYSDLPGTDHELPALDGGTHYDRRLRDYPVTIGWREPEQIDPAFSRTEPDLRAKYAGSAAFLFGKERALCEAYAACGWDSTPTRLRRIAAWQIMQGINYFVPQAVSHRFFDKVKYHAPPEFLSGGWQQGLREFNDFLAKYCRLASQGRQVVPIGVLDPSPAILAGTADGSAIHRLCDRLNRQSLGYVITDRGHADAFEFLLDPLSPPDELPPPDATFDGGDVLWMHRRLDDGTEYLLIASVWTDETLAGTLAWQGRTYPLELSPGEIAVIGGPWEEYRRPQPPRGSLVLKPSEIRRLNDNILPLRLLRSWRIETKRPLALALLVPEAMEGQVACDGIRLIGGTPVQEFDDAYRRYHISGHQGVHSLTLGCKPNPETPILLKGDFAASLKAAGQSARCVYAYYQRSLMAPKSISVTLRQAAPLSLGDWIEQGLPFYDGAVAYEFDLDGEFPQAVLQSPHTWIARVSLDGQDCGAILWAPWQLPLGDLHGRHRLTVTLWNSLAGRMDGYLRTNGLLEAPVLFYGYE